MATLTAWKFPTPYGAENALIKLERLNKQMLINLHDAELISTNLSDEQEAKLREAFGLEA